MSFPRTKSENGSGIISSILGLLLVSVFLVSTAKISEMILLSQRLNAIAQNSVRQLAVVSSLNNPTALTDTEIRIGEILPKYRSSLNYSYAVKDSLATFTVSLPGYTLSIWPGIGTGPFDLSASASARLEP